MGWDHAIFSTEFGDICSVPPVDREQSVNFDRMADRYDETRGGMERGRAYAALLAPHMVGSGPALEIGVGTGLVALAVQEQGRSVIGVDISRAMIRRAQSRLGPDTRVALADAMALPIADGALECVFGAHVLHLVSDVAAVMTEVARVLRPGGRFVVARPNNRARQDSDLAPLIDALDHAIRGRARQDDAERVAAVAVAAGLRAVTKAAGAEEDVEGSSPESYAAQVAARTFSAFWDVPDEIWNSVVEPAVAEMLALPDPARPRRFYRRTDVQVFEKT